VHIRPANLADLSRCYHISGAFATDYVWQVDQRAEEDVITVTLRLVRLPRPLKASYPPWGEGLLDQWERGDCVLVAENGQDILGYTVMSLQPDRELGWVDHLLVAAPARRQGIGTALLRAAHEWGAQRGVRRVMLAVQSKNDPAVRFCRKLGLSFCGFNERYFVNLDIALFFGGFLR